MRAASGVGLASIDDSNSDVLCVWFPAPALGLDAPDPHLMASPANALTGVRREVVQVRIADLDAGPTDTADAYLRLHLLSHRLVRPRSINLDGMFAVLPNVAWTSSGPVSPARLTEVIARAYATGQAIVVNSLDKFPRMLDFVCPSGVRVADASRVRLGAYLAEGTTVMHEGFVNYNAGTLGASMVEGRISQGVIVGSGSDVGGGASIMGTLSGGGEEVVTLGEDCLVGANAGVGISLGDRSVVEAGLYVTAGTKVTLPDGRVLKALELSGASDTLFRRNSTNGRIEVVPMSAQWGELNESLHANN